MFARFFIPTWTLSTSKKLKIYCKDISFEPLREFSFNTEVRSIYDPIFGQGAFVLPPKKATQNQKRRGIRSRQSLLFFYVLFYGFWCVGAPTWHPLGPSWRPDPFRSKKRNGPEASENHLWGSTFEGFWMDFAKLVQWFYRWSEDRFLMQPFFCRTRVGRPAALPR